MEKKLFILTYTLIVTWFLGFFVFHATVTIHIFLLFAIVTYLIGLLYNKTLMGE